MLHSRCQLASWAFVAVLITVLPGVGGENSPRGTVSSGTFHQEANNCLPAQLGGIPPRRGGRGCGRVPRGSAHASYGAESTCERPAAHFGPAPKALGCRGAEEVQSSIGFPDSRGSGRGARERALFFPPLFSLFFPLEFLGSLGPVLSSRGWDEDGNRWLRRNRGRTRDSAAGWKGQHGLPDTSELAPNSPPFIKYVTLGKVVSFFFFF